MDSNEADGKNVLVEIPAGVWASAMDFLQRVVGPVAELSELLSDKIRFVRYRTALKTIALAQKIAEDAGVEIHPVPLKFLVPFLEQCSLEDEESDLIKQWANLLVSACERYDGSHPAFTDMLSQIGPREAQLLRNIWDKSRKNGFDQLNALLDLYAEQSDQDEDWSAGISLDEELKRNYRFLIMAGGGPRGSLPKGFYDQERHTAENIRSLLILERQNLVKIKTRSDRHKEVDLNVYVVQAALTPLGHDFVAACERASAQGEDLP